MNKMVLRLYPRVWRERYGEEFTELLATSPMSWRNAVDIARSAFDAQLRVGGWRMRKWLPWFLLAIVEAVIGWLNYHATDDVQPVAASLLVASFGFVLWRPRLAWLFIPVLWLAIPVSSIIADATNYHPGSPKPAPLYETLVALIPTVLGATLALGTRWARRLTT